MKNVLKLAVLILSLGLFACSSNSKKLIEWVGKNKGSQFSNEKAKELNSLFGSPVDTIHGGDYYIEAYSPALFLGPGFEPQEGKRLYDEAISSREIFFKHWEDYMNKTGQEQGLTQNKFSDMNSHWNEYTTAETEFREKFENLYNQKSKNTKFTLRDYFESIKKIYPNKSNTEYVDLLKKLNIRGVDDSYFDNLFKTTYVYQIDKSTSYKKYMGKEKEDIVDFDIWTKREIIVNEKGIIEESSGSNYCITDDSKKMLMNKIVGIKMVAKIGSINGSIIYNSNGTYHYTNNMFEGTDKEGNWRINCDGEIEATNQESNAIIVKKGVRVGETTYQ